MDQGVFITIKRLADEYSAELKKQVDMREKEMEDDDTSHYLLYRVLGVTDDEGRLIDLYQNKGRFLYKYAGAFLEEAAVVCIKHKFPDAQKVRIPNTSGSHPKHLRSIAWPVMPLTKSNGEMQQRMATILQKNTQE